MIPPEPSERTIFKTRGPLDPVNDSAIYVPRPELDQLLRAAQLTRVDAYLALLSSRQTGKTTLLYQLRHRLRPRGYGVALIDLAVVLDQPEDQLYRFVASGIRSELEPNLRAADKRDVSALPTNPLEFRRFAMDMARQVRAPRIVVLIDEVEAVPESLADAFFGTIRNIFSSRRKEDEVAFEKYLFVLCGAKELHRLSSGPNSPLNIAERIYLQDLTTPGVQMLAANFTRAGILAPPETAQWIFDQTGGHPYLTQKLCAIVEQWRPQHITPDLVQRAADEILRGDDHLEKTILQVETEPLLRDQLRTILAGPPVPFSRLNPAVARLELAGAIRDDQQCVVRNAIYHKAFQAHLNPPAPQPKRRILPWGRILIALLAVVVFAINAPFLINYANDIVLSPRSVNEPAQIPTLGAHAIFRYAPILRANDPEWSSLTVETDQVTIPLSVTFSPESPDIERAGDAQRRFDQAGHQEQFKFRLNQNVVPYNPFQPAVPHQRIHLIFVSAGADRPSYTHTADFRVVRGDPRKVFAFRVAA